MIRGLSIALPVLVATATVAGAVAAGPPAVATSPSADRARPAARSGGHGPRGIIVWTHRTPSGAERLLVAHADGSDVRRLTAAQPNSSDIDAQVSPDGRWVAYQEDHPDFATIHLVRPNGRRDHVLDVGCTDPCVAALSPTWMSNRRIAFTRLVGPFDGQTGAAAAAALWSVRNDGTRMRRLSGRGIDGRFEESYLHVSQDRRFQTFRRVRSATGDAAIFRRDLPSGRLTRLTPWALRAEVEDLSTARRGPTKNLLVFESFGRGDPDATFVDLATVPATCRSRAACAHRIQWLTDNATSGRRNANPQWSPKGRRLVFTDRASIDVENAEIWTMQLASGRRHRVSFSPAFDYRPTWGVAR
jgi:WD40-like Beta Propeller Repeat